MKATDALGYFLCFWVMAGLLLLAGKTLAAELAVRERDGKGRGRIRGGNIYGRASAVKGRFENGKIHRRNWPGRSDRF
jgi:hypothetical protein